MRTLPEHIDKDDLKVIMDKYYSGVKNTEIIKEHNLRISTTRLHTLFPDVICEEKCLNCGGEMKSKALSKSEIQHGYPARHTWCTQCDHVGGYVKTCECETCTRKREKWHKEQQDAKKRMAEIRQYQKDKQLAEERKQRLEEFIRVQKIKEQRERKVAAIHKKFTHRTEYTRGYSDLSYRDKVYLGCMLKGYSNEDFTTIKPINPIGFTGSMGLSSEILHYLTYTQAIGVDPNSEIDAFIMDAEIPDKIKSYNPFAVLHYLKIDLSDDRLDTIEKLIDLKPPQTPEEKQDLQAVWKSLMVEDCIAYLTLYLEKAGHFHEPGEKTYMIFDKLLNYFPVCQVFNIIWRKVKWATKAYDKGLLTADIIGVRILRECEEYGEYAYTNNHPIEDYSRPIMGLPHSVLHKFLYNQILGLGEAGDLTVPVVARLAD